MLLRQPKKSDRKEKIGDSTSLARSITILAIVLDFFFFIPFCHQLPPYTALPYFLAFLSNEISSYAISKCQELIGVVRFFWKDRLVGEKRKIRFI